MARLIKFSQPMCRGCMVMENVIKEVNPDIEIHSVDLSIEPYLGGRFDITGVPTLILQDDNKSEIKRHVGTMDEEEFEKWLSL